MKISIFAIAMMMSVGAFALGEGQKGLDCNPEHWTCDQPCREKKAQSCGISLIESDETPKHSLGGSKPGAKTKSAQGQGM